MKNKKGKKLAAKKVTPPNKSAVDSQTGLSLCLGKVVSGLHIDFTMDKKGKKYGSLAVFSLDEEPFAVYDLKWAEKEFWSMMKQFSQVKGSLVIALPKKQHGKL